MNRENLVGFLWSVADLLRGHLRQWQYGRVILPFTVLRRLECVLEPTREKEVRQATEKNADKPEGTRERVLRNAAGLQKSVRGMWIGPLAKTTASMLR